MITRPPEHIQKQPKKGITFTRVMGSSKRLTLTYIVMGIWVALAIFAIYINADLYALAVYFASGLPIIIGYLWSETSRPSIKDASDMVKNINTRIPTDRRGIYDNFYGGNNYSNYTDYNNPYNNTYPIYNPVNPINQNQEDQNFQISIYSDDGSAELQVSQSKLTTLMNTGYVDSVGNKYTFKKSLLDQVKSLISDMPVPNI